MWPLHLAASSIHHNRVGFEILIVDHKVYLMIHQTRTMYSIVVVLLTLCASVISFFVTICTSITVLYKQQSQDFVLIAEKNFIVSQLLLPYWKTLLVQVHLNLWASLRVKICSQVHHKWIMTLTGKRMMKVHYTLPIAMKLKWNRSRVMRVKSSCS